MLFINSGERIGIIQKAEINKKTTCTVEQGGQVPSRRCNSLHLKIEYYRMKYIEHATSVVALLRGPPIYLRKVIGFFSDAGEMEEDEMEDFMDAAVKLMIRVRLLG